MMIELRKTYVEFVKLESLSASTHKAIAPGFFGSARASRAVDGALAIANFHSQNMPVSQLAGYSGRAIHPVPCHSERSRGISNSHENAHQRANFSSAN